jgi:hypothetical protein
MMSRHVPPPDYEPPMRHELAKRMREAMLQAWRTGFMFGVMAGLCAGSALTLIVLIAAIRFKHG